MQVRFHSDSDTSDQGFVASFHSAEAVRSEPRLFANKFDLHLVSDGDIELVSGGKITLMGDVMVSDNQLSLLSTLLQMNESIGKCECLEHPSNGTRTFQILKQVQSQVKAFQHNIEQFNTSLHEVATKVRDYPGSGDTNLLTRLTDLERRLDLMATSVASPSGNSIIHPNCPSNCSGNGVCTLQYNSTAKMWQPACSCYPGYLHPTCQFRDRRLEGNGRDGNRTITGNEIFKTHVGLHSIALAGSTVLSISDTKEWMKDGVEILVIQMQGSNAGVYEFHTARQVVRSTVYLTHPLVHNYTTSATESAQVVKVPNYHKLVLDGNGKLDTQPWNGKMGGIVAVRAKTLIINENASVNANERGFRGGPARVSGTTPGYYSGVTGESWKVTGFIKRGSRSNNAGGGGSSYCRCGEAAGSGGYGTAGSLPSGTSCSRLTKERQGEPGIAYGDATVSKLFLGSGGGSGCRPTSSATCGFPDGSRGGGLIVLQGGALTVHGTVSTGGEAAKSVSGCRYTTGGAGSGGTILVNAVTVHIDTGNALFDVKGGSPTYISNSRIYSGQGGKGRVRINYNTLNGFPYGTIHSRTLQFHYPDAHWEKVA